MTTFNTGNPVPSTAVKDLYDNSQTEDEFVNGDAPMTITRTGKSVKTMAGMNADIANAIATVGYNFIGDYIAGLTVANYNQIFRYSGEFYKALATTSLPYTITGVPATDLPFFGSIGDAILRANLAATTGAGLVGYDQNLTYPAGTVGEAIKNARTGFTNVKAFGFVGNGTDADTLKFQEAINSGLPLEIDPGTFQLTLAQTLNLEGGPSVCALVLKTGLVLQGAGKGKTILKLADNQSTDASPKYFNIFAGNTVISDSHLSDFTIDVNGQNNKISPNRGVGVYNPYNCAGIFVSGRVATVGADARMLNCSIARIAVNNSPGVTCIATGQQEASAVMSDNVRIYDCDFYNNGIDSSDHSSIYMWGNSIWVERCNFDHPTPSTGVAGPVVAAELHGSSNFFNNNDVNNYAQMVWISGNSTGPSIGMHVCNNRARVTWVGAGLYSLANIALGLRNVIINDNNIEIIPGTISNPGLTFPKSGLLLNMQAGQSDRVSARGNTIVCSDVVSNIGVYIGAGAGAFMQDTDVRSNMISGFSRGVALGLGATGTCFDTVIADNNICNLTPSAAVALPDGIHVSGAHGALHILNNMIAGTVVNRGVFMGSFGGPATLDSLNVQGNAVAANATTAIYDGMVVSGRRQGKQALTFASLPAQSTWKLGDVAYVSPAGLNTSPPNVVREWLRLTNGTANVLNTDWLEQRMPKA